MSKVARTFVGDIGAGEMILRCSASSFDAVLASDDGHKITFDSRWTNISRPTAIGIAGESFVTIPGGTINIWRIFFTYPDFGFKPFAEVRRLAGNVLYDDYWDSSFVSGSYNIIGTGATYGGSSPINNGQTPSGSQVLYIVYPIPVPSG
jgi:hypothetical protein